MYNNQWSYICGYLTEGQDRFIELSDAVWSVPETGLKEYKSSKLLMDALEEEGFQIERNVDDISTAFIATYGSGKPVIGLAGSI